MASACATISTVFEGLGDLGDLRAGSSRPAGARRSNNTHIHLPPNFSAFDTVEQAVDLAASQGVRVVGVSNYYHYGVYADFASRARRAGIFPLFGTEIIALLDDLAQSGVRINDPANPGKMYICGKGITRFDPLSIEAAGLLQDIRDRDSSRMAEMTDRLAAVFGRAGLDTGLDEAAVKARIVGRHACAPETVYLQERHICQAFQEVLAERATPEDQTAILARAYGTAPQADIANAVAVQNEIRARLMKAGKPAYVPETFVDFDHAYRLIVALGGVPCYPVLADGVKPICEFEEDPARLVAELKARGITCTEFIPLRNQPDVLARYVGAMRAAGLVVTAGTEHNTRDLAPIEPACVGGQPVPQEAADLFWEGACVVAAHQYLVCRGQMGFVDASGLPNPAFGSADARIAAFRGLGASVIDAYLAR